MTTPVGYHGLLVPADMDFAYQASQPPWNWLMAGLGRDGQKVKAGTVLKYRFGVGTFADEAAGNALLEHTVKAMNLGGGQAGYPVEMKVGTPEDAVFFFTARAKQNEAAFALGPQNLMIDLPIRVRGSGEQRLRGRLQHEDAVVPLHPRGYGRHGMVPGADRARRTRYGWATCSCATTRT